MKYGGSTQQQQSFCLPQKVSDRASTPAYVWKLSQWCAGKLEFQAASANTLCMQLVPWHTHFKQDIYSALPAGRILLSTIPENDSFLKKLLGVDMQKFKPSIPHLVSVQEPIQIEFLILHLCACLQQLFRAHIHLALSKRRVAIAGLSVLHLCQLQQWAAESA